MSLQNYSASLTIETGGQLEKLVGGVLLSNILSSDNESGHFINISIELVNLLHSESQFNRSREDDFDKINYSDFLTTDMITKLTSLKDAKPWFDSDDKTFIKKTLYDFEFYDSEELMTFCKDFLKYLDKFKWDTKKPTSFGLLDQVKLLLILASFAFENKLKIKSIVA